MKLNPITFSYSKKKDPILKDVHVTLVEEKINVIVGLNGAGKTTLLDVLSGVHSLSDFPPPFNPKEVVYQLQGIYIPPVLKGKDIVRMILKSDSDLPFKQLADSFVSRLEQTEKEMLDRLWKTKFGEMSVGERRWLTIRAVCELDRKLYIFDEPTAGIDPNSRSIIMAALENLAKRDGVYVVMSTHILHELSFLNCVINFLHAGNIQFHGDYPSFLQMNETDNPDIAFQKFLQEVG